MIHLLYNLTINIMYWFLLLSCLYFLSVFVRSTWNNGFELDNVFGIAAFGLLLVVIVAAMRNEYKRRK